MDVKKTIKWSVLLLHMSMEGMQCFFIAVNQLRQVVNQYFYLQVMSLVRLDINRD